jgi:hypothetical protein
MARSKAAILTGIVLFLALSVFALLAWPAGAQGHIIFPVSIAGDGTTWGNYESRNPSISASRRRAI